MRLIFKCAVVVLTLHACAQQKMLEHEPFTIAFGSCNNQDKEQKLWDDINAHAPDLWIWLGDNIYADADERSVFEEKYHKQFNQPGYKALRKQADIIGTWDDHDYGINNGGGDFSFKKESRDLALDFLQVPNSNEIWNRTGMYQSYVYEHGDITIRVLLLDIRYFKDPKPQNFQERMRADILGDAQWAWLENELAKSEDILIIGSGIQIIPEDHRYEKWSDYPFSRDQLFSYLSRKTDTKVILLSGDRHIAEYSIYKQNNQHIHEITSSGMTHSYATIGDEPNRHRQGALYAQLNYGILNIDGTGKVQAEIRGDNGYQHMQVEID